MRSQEEALKRSLWRWRWLLVEACWTHSQCTLLFHMSRVQALCFQELDCCQLQKSVEVRRSMWFVCISGQRFLIWTHSNKKNSNGVRGASVFMQDGVYISTSADLHKGFGLLQFQVCFGCLWKTRFFLTFWDVDIWICRGVFGGHASWKCSILLLKRVLFFVPQWCFYVIPAFMVTMCGSLVDALV